MRSQGFDFDDVLTDEHSVLVDVYVYVAQEDDEWGNERPPIPQYILQDEEVDLQPLSGSEKVERSGTQYESTHRFFCTPPQPPIPVGAKVAVKDALTKTVLGHKRVVDVAMYGTHIEVEVADDK